LNVATRATAAQPDRTWPNRLQRWRSSVFQAQTLPVLALAVGIATTALFCNSARHFRQLEHERIERTLAADIAEAVETKLNTSISLLNSVAGLFNTSQHVSHREFINFFNSLSVDPDQLRGIQGVGFSAVVPGNQITAFETKIRNEDQPDFTIHPAGQRELTTAIVYLMPDDWRNQRAIGYDMYSEATRREAMLLAASTGETTLSAPVRLVQETNHHPQPGTLLYHPIYENGNSGFQSSIDRMRRLRGWAYSPLRMGDLINSALAILNNPDKIGTGFLIYDGTKRDASKLLFDNLGLAGSHRLTDPTWVQVEVAKRTWLIGTQLDHRNISPSGWGQELTLTAILGLSLSILGAILTQRLVDNHLDQVKALAREREAAGERALAATVFDTSPVATVVTDPKGMILRVNPAFTQLSGYSRLETRGHKTNLLRSGRHEISFYQDLWQTLIQKGYWSGEIWNRHRNGQIRLHELQINAVLDGRDQVTNYLCIYRDVTERHAQEKQIRHMATHDPLTGLPNRALMLDRLSHSLAIARREQQRLGLIFIDLNGFKPINDTYGHLAGDQLLQAVAQRLLGCLRESDSLGRIGGDEFVLLIPNAEHLEHMQELAERLQNALRAPFKDIGEVVVRISASFGIARWPDHAADADQLMHAADQAMYRAKAMASGHICLASPTAGDGPSGATTPALA
jgi:diguanylate cyclase (GGDEF)-like protein/PAS domain S-box-containing protein